MTRPPSLEDLERRLCTQPRVAFTLENTGETADLLGAVGLVVQEANVEREQHGLAPVQVRAAAFVVSAAETEPPLRTFATTRMLWVAFALGMIVSSIVIAGYAFWSRP